MGIPDYLTLDETFADKHELPSIEYQASFFRHFGKLSIDQDGRLIEHQHSHESSGEADEIMKSRRVERGDRHLAYHGDIQIWGKADGTSFDVVLRFTEGIVTSVIEWTAYPEELKLLAYAE